MPLDRDGATDGGAEGETVHLPSDPGMPLHRLLAPDAVTEEIDRLERAQRPGGGWPVDFDSSSPAAALERRGYTTVDAIATLRTHGRV